MSFGAKWLEVPSGELAPCHDMQDTKRYRLSLTIATLALAACGGGQVAQSPAPETEAAVAPDTTSGGAEAPVADANPAVASAGGSNEFVLNKSQAEKSAHNNSQSKIKPSLTEAAMKFVVVDKDKGPLPGVVISMTGPDGHKYYTEETNAEGYAEVLVPVGQKYDLVYLSLGRKDIAASVAVTDEPNQNVRLTLRYKRFVPPPRPPRPGSDAPAEQAAEPRFALDGVTFDTGKATLRPESYPRLDSVVEYMTHKKSARIQISGHTDNVGNPKSNKTLSEKRAQACRDYVISKGIDGSRIEAIGYGDEWPIASNDNEDGRRQNRRIEALEE